MSTRAKWSSYWREICAPKLLAKKNQLGRVVPERDIAAFVEAATGKPSGRALVGHWLRGDREPFISQFFALCQKLELEPFEVLRQQPAGERQPLARIHERARPARQDNLNKRRG